MENINFEIVFNGNLCTYEIDFDERKIDELKNMLMNYSVYSETTIKYNSFYDTLEKSCRKNNIEYDEIEEKDCEFSDYDDDVVISNVQLCIYPTLYKVLFSTDLEDIFIKLDLYINDTEIDSNISKEEKIQLLSKLLSSITIRLIETEQIDEIKSQISTINRISRKHEDEKRKLLLKMNGRLKNAYHTTKIIERFSELTNNDILKLEFNNN